MKLTIAQKLLLMMLAITTSVIGLIACATRLSITSGFTGYIAKSELSRTDDFAEVLEDEYANHGANWDLIKSDPERMWHVIYRSERRRPPPEAGGDPRLRDGPIMEGERWGPPEGGGPRPIWEGEAREDMPIEDRPHRVL